ncbi:MAG: PIN domain-containing protein [Dehalococcoidales bacterium]|nr:PIN domain-containing protein [Dehalococcoidales bacterium]
MSKLPHLYLDTSVLAGVLQKEHNASVSLIQTIVKKNWHCSTSIFASMELFDISQDNQYVLNQLQLGVHIKKAHKALDQKTLSTSSINEIRRSVDRLFAVQCPNLNQILYKKQTWNKAWTIKASTCISAPDVIHMATAMEAGCDLLVTLDSFFLKEAVAYIPACRPEQVEKTLIKEGFNL